MAKFPSFPTVLDNCKSICISDLKKWKYFGRNTVRSGVITWSRRGEKTGSISITVSTSAQDAYLELDYKCNDKPICYRVPLITKTSNLGKGVVWFFICPKTGKVCRKLHMIDTYFYHHSGSRGCMYEKQIQSKKYRQIEKTFGVYFKSDQLYDELYKKHLKKTYRGKPTKKYLRLTEQMIKLDKISHHDIERLMVM